MKTLLRTLLLGILAINTLDGHCQLTAIKTLMTEVNYGVPASPAFELLPGKASEVTHLSSPHDIGASIGAFFNGSKLQSGAAVDIRPFAFTGGSLDDYQNKYLTRLAWRTTLSAGTTSGKSEGNDVFLGAGLHITLIDKSDPRNDKTYINDLTQAYLKAVFKIIPDANETAEQLQERIDQAAKSAEVQKIRDDFAKRSWNAIRWDVGIGASDRAASGYVKADSLFRDRLGAWSAVGLPLGKKGQLTLSGNTAWVSHQNDTTERHRYVAGARARFFLSESFALSGEYARIYSRYASAGLNENWGHLAVVAEFKIPKLGGWFSLAYGGDSNHRTDKSAKFAVNYAIYMDRLIKR